jgi:hypothetical protein
MTMKEFTLALAMTALGLPIARATDPPDVKEGLWSIHTQTTDNPGAKKSEGTYTLCRDHTYDLSVRARAKTVKGCTTVSENFQPGKYSVEVHCTIAGSVTVSQGTTTFQGDTAAHSENHASYTPALYGVSESTMVMDQKYVGSCPAGSHPGDRTNSDGTVIHLGKK